MSKSDKSYFADGPSFLYPGAGDPLPPGGARVHLLTKGHTTTQGTWGDPHFIGWAPLHKRDPIKESMLRK